MAKKQHAEDQAPLGERLANQITHAREQVEGALVMARDELYQSSYRDLTVRELESALGWLDYAATSGERAAAVDVPPLPPGETETEEA